MAPLREDIAGARQLRFRVAGRGLHLFKAKGESVQEVYLKVATYAFYAPQHDLAIDPRVDCKYQPNVASVDLSGDVRFWARCGDVSIDQITYVLKHSDADEVVIARADVDLPAYVASLKRQIHYRYTTGKLRVLAFRPLDEWFDPDDVLVPADAYELFEF